MTDNIQISTGLKRVTINGDANRFVEIDVLDTLFLERFYNLAGKVKEYQFPELSDSDDAGKYLDALKNANLFLREKIDETFGEGTSMMVFGESLPYNMEAYGQFIEGMSGVIFPDRKSKIEAYLPKESKGLETRNGRGARKPRKRK